MMTREQIISKKIDSNNIREYFRTQRSSLVLITNEKKILLCMFSEIVDLHQHKQKDVMFTSP